MQNIITYKIIVSKVIILDFVINFCLIKSFEIILSYNDAVLVIKSVISEKCSISIFDISELNNSLTLFCMLLFFLTSLLVLL
jgi:hypothetical protein